MLFILLNINRVIIDTNYDIFLKYICKATVYINKICLSNLGLYIDTYYFYIIMKLVTYLMSKFRA